MYQDCQHAKTEKVIEEKNNLLIFKMQYIIKILLHNIEKGGFLINFDKT